MEQKQDKEETKEKNEQLIDRFNNSLAARIFSYAYIQDEAFLFIRRLKKHGKLFIEKNEGQLDYFFKTKYDQKMKLEGNKFQLILLSEGIQIVDEVIVQSEVDLLRVAEGFPNLQKIQKLKVVLMDYKPDVYLIKPDKQKVIINFMKKVEFLDLTIKIGQLFDQLIYKYFDQPGIFKNMQTLRIGGSKYKQYKYIIRWFAFTKYKFSNLKELYIDFLFLTSVTDFVDKFCFEKMPNLEILELQNFDFSALHALFSNNQNQMHLGKLRTLRMKDEGRNQNSELKFIHLRQIEQLSLQFDFIDMQLLQQFPNLKQLEMDTMQIENISWAQNQILSNLKVFSIQVQNSINMENLKLGEIFQNLQKIQIKNSNIVYPRHLTNCLNTLQHFECIIAENNTLKDFLAIISFTTLKICKLEIQLDRFLNVNTEKWPSVENQSFLGKRAIEKLCISFVQRQNEENKEEIKEEIKEEVKEELKEQCLNQNATEFLLSFLKAFHGAKIIKVRNPSSFVTEGQQLLNHLLEQSPKAHLILSGEINQETIGRLFNKMKTTPLMLKGLDLSKVKITQNVVEKFAAILPFNKSLKVLAITFSMELSTNCFEQLRYIFKAIEEHPSIKQLSLEFIFEKKLSKIIQKDLQKVVIDSCKKLNLLKLKIEKHGLSKGTKAKEDKWKQIYLNAADDITKSMKTSYCVSFGKKVKFLKAEMPQLCEINDWNDE